MGVRDFGFEASLWRWRQGSEDAFEPAGLAKGSGEGGVVEQAQQGGGDPARDVDLAPPN